jgi:uncharacterized protein YbjT (DUF2867 family)
VFVGEVTDPDSIATLCKDVDFIISTIGITRQKDGLTYLDVDYQGNRNLLDCASRNGVSKFVYVSVFNAHLMPELKSIQAKERFVRELVSSGLNYAVVRPTGFFSDMLEFLEMAKKGKVYLIGSGEHRINPIHGQDLAEVCLAALNEDDNEIDVGGPETFTHRQIAEMAFDVLRKNAKVPCMPLWTKAVMLLLMRIFTSSKTYSPVEFLWTALSMDGVAPSYGKLKLMDFYRASADEAWRAN